ncbi:MAG: molybdenum cofactor biosynthesis protein MoaE [Acidobacteria bacterium]|nr:molybdenum cofactor biosynthesis protein MoaE [Acidobacteriota bacterium]
MLKDITGAAEQDLELGAGCNVQSVFDHYAQKFPRLGELSRSILVSHNRQFAERETPLADGDEVALLPPVSGGSSGSDEIRDPEGHLFRLTRLPIDGQAVKRELVAGHDGAVVTFEGVVRNHTKGRKTRCLDYECYQAMAIEVMARLGREIASAHDISRIAMVHRMGRMEIGETSVAVIVAAQHRKPAFEAALEGINRLKRTVPIWKKEYFEDGEVWVEGEWDESLLSR